MKIDDEIDDNDHVLSSFSSSMLKFETIFKSSYMLKNQDRLKVASTPIDLIYIENTQYLKKCVVVEDR